MNRSFLFSGAALALSWGGISTTSAVAAPKTVVKRAPKTVAVSNPIVIGAARFTVLTPNCIRLETARDGKFVDAPSLFAINRAARFDAFKIEKRGKSTTIDTGALRLTYTPDGQPFSADNLSATIRGGKSWTPGAKNPGNLGGTIRTLDGASGPVDLGQGVLSRDGWALIDNSRDPLLDGDWVKARPQNAGTDWYLLGYGHDYRAALKSLTTVGGGVPLPRKNVLGAWYSRYWPISSAEYRKFVDEYAQHDFPLDNMVLDMDWHRDGWTGWSWNRKLLPDAEQLLKDLHAQGLQTTLNLHPADGVAPSEDRYAAFMGALGEKASGQTVPFDAADKKQMNAFSREVLSPLRRDGVDFWWLDWQQYPQTRSITELTNLWWLNELLFRDTAQDGRRGVSFSRWAGWGDHRHPIHFSGDADTGWNMLAFEVPFTATAGNVGCFFWSHDIGGHYGNRNEESYTRWCQFGALSAALRSHSTRDATTDRRPWKYAKWAEDSMRVSFHLRSELFPYIYASVAQSTRESVPLTRPIYFDYPSEEAAYHNGQEYLFGDNLLVAPVVSPGIGPRRVAHQNVYFPGASQWFNVFSQEKYVGGSTALCAADIDEMPLFARGGVPIPMQPYTPRMTSAKLSTLRVRAFPGMEGKTGVSSLYEDDGDSDAYKNGAFAQTPLRYSRRGSAVEIGIGATHGKFAGQLKSRALQIELPATRRAVSATLGGQKLSIRYDAASATNTITIPARLISLATIVKINVADADFNALRNAAQARRMKGVTGQSFAPQSPRSLMQSALLNELSTSERNEALAVVGVGMVAQNQSPTFARGEVRDVFFAPPRVLDGDEARVETVSRSKASFKVGGQTVRFPEIFGSEDIAPSATISVSGSENGYGFRGATDKVLSGYPEDKTAEWSAGKKEGATLRLTWTIPQKINRVALYDRPNTTDNTTRSVLTFSDGTSIEVDALPNDGETPNEVRFPTKTVDWVEWKALEVRGENAGLSEIAVFQAP
ncbi:protein of unknown function (DUF5110) [Abditibacterium utsteinense]|uniref:Uncharacterized protein n=1 Tax=Abditibacterium utsteinense TaxID=1960156 RepID=A0A2S8SRT8_9BACT|nr:TIM-barrel domain-containing protein [Abditibacterium utsteinense]PQV63523.1 protein of unknown function (DUF5110) [Abditibacterium utsteinense]